MAEFWGRHPRLHWATFVIAAIASLAVFNLLVAQRSWLGAILWAVAWAASYAFVIRMARRRRPIPEGKPIGLSWPKADNSRAD